MLDAVFWIQGVEDGVSIALVSSGEDDDIEVLADVFDNFSGVGSNVDVAANNLILYRLKGDFQFVAFHHCLISVD